MQRLHDRGEIYLGTYRGPYCVSCEEFKQEKELIDGNCAIHGIPVEMLEEENYFFPLSKYQEPLLQLYEEHPDFVLPDFRRNEVVAFVKEGLRDLSISRSGTDWGIPVPWDPKHVIYVWVDALLNYATAIGFGTEPEMFAARWPADLHVIGKDIARFHAVIWPAMLMAAGRGGPADRVRARVRHDRRREDVEEPNVTGVHPFELLDIFGVDSYRYFFLRQFAFGNDGDYSFESMVGAPQRRPRQRPREPRGARARDARLLLRRRRSRGRARGWRGRPARGDRAGGRSLRRADARRRAAVRGGRRLVDRRSRQRLPRREGALEAREGSGCAPRAGERPVRERRARCGSSRS